MESDAEFERAVQARMAANAKARMKVIEGGPAPAEPMPVDNEPVVARHGDIHLSLAGTDSSWAQVRRAYEEGRHLDYCAGDVVAARESREVAQRQLLTEAGDVTSAAKRSGAVNDRVAAELRVMALQRVATELESEVELAKKIEAEGLCDQARAKAKTSARDRLRMARLAVEKHEAAARSYIEALSEFDAAVGDCLAAGEPVQNLSGELARLDGADCIRAALPRLGGGSFATVPRGPVEPAVGVRYRIQVGPEGAALPRPSLMGTAPPYILKPATDYYCRLGVGHGGVLGMMGGHAVVTSIPPKKAKGA